MSYFNNKGGETEPMCTLCGETVKMCGNTSNQLKQLKTKHERVQEEQQEAKCPRGEQTPSKQATWQLTLAAAIDPSSSN